MKRNLTSIISIIIVGCFFFKSVLKEKFWKLDFVIKVDAKCYYQYLPAAIIHHDLELKFIDDTTTPNRNRYVFFVGPLGTYFNKYTCGVAVLHLPFYLIATFLAPFFGQQPDGYSDIFEIFLFISSAFYTLVGLFFLRKVLLKYFNDFSTALTLLTLGIGTNLFVYVTSEPAMSHSFSFCLASVFIWLTLKWHESADLKTSFFLGSIAGLIILLRPINAIIILIFICFSIKNLSDIKLQLKYLFSKSKFLIVIAVSAFVFITPQLYYWKLLTGQWIYYSYGDERFFFTHPHLIDGFFSFRNGVLIYTPVIIFSIIGLFLLGKKVPAFRLAIPLYFIVFSYIVLSWWCWYYSGFGNRAFIDSYPALSVPMCSTFYWITSNSLIKKAVITFITSLLIYLNLFQSWQYKYGIMHWSAMNKKAYMSIFMKTYLPKETRKLLTEPDSEKEKKFGRE